MLLNYFQNKVRRLHLFFLLRDLLKCLSSQIDTLTTDCLNSEQLVKEIIENCSIGRKAHKHKPRAYSSHSEDSDVSNIFSHDSLSWEALSTHSSGRDQAFLQSYDPTTSESEEMNLKCGLSVSDSSISTTSTTMNSPSSSLCPTDSDFGPSDDMSESARSSLTTVSTIAASSKCDLEVRRERLLWKRAILLVRIVLMLLPQRLKQKKDLPCKECRGEEHAICSVTNVISDDTSDISFHHKRALFEKYVKMTNCFNILPKTIETALSLPVGQAETDLKQDNAESITTAMADRALVVSRLSKDTSDALEWSLKRKMGSLKMVSPQADQSQDSYDDRTPLPVSSELDKAIESEIKGKLIENQWAQTSNTILNQRTSLCHGDGSKEITTVSSHFNDADQHHKRNNQTLWDVKAVSLAAEDQSLRLKTVNIKDNSSHDGSQEPNGPVKGKDTYRHMADVIITQGDISVAMTDKQKCQENSSQPPIPSAPGEEEVLNPLKSASESDLSSPSSREAEVQGVDKVAVDQTNINVMQEYWEQQTRTPTVHHTSLEMLKTNAHYQSLSQDCIDMETTLLDEGRTLTLTKDIKNKLEFSIKQKMLYQLWGLPVVVQRSLDTMRPPPAMKDSKTLREVETFGKPHKEGISLRRWNFPKRIVKSLKTFEIPKAMSFKNLSLGHENKPLKPKRSKMPSSSDNQDHDIQDCLKRSAVDNNAGGSSKI